ncbi:hypothetical protein [Psychrobacter lutiphocae]|uniref:hypothetical protein n=1 Tax=Psychrobacter lutiphocae TaxID=540500 RepID=UPI00035D0314|nr:hypothetical protein [Psychrobacter lutiphocae]
MIYEFIATISAGFAMAGLALIIRHLSKLIGFNSPKWLIPIFAGIGMLGFQIHQEYHWHEQQIEKLPKDAQVLKLIEGKTWFRPWSYIKPQVIRFMAVAPNKRLDSSQAEVIKQVNLYLFERRMSTKIVPQLVNCTQQTLADPIGLNTNIDSDQDSLTSSDNAPNTLKSLNELIWQPLAKDDKILQAVCTH